MYWTLSIEDKMFKSFKGLPASSILKPVGTPLGLRVSHISEDLGYFSAKRKTQGTLKLTICPLGCRTPTEQDKS